MNLHDPDFCESRCPVCTNARKGKWLARILQKIEMAVTFGGCPAGRARRAKYGVGPDQDLPPGGVAGEATTVPGKALSGAGKILMVLVSHGVSPYELLAANDIVILETGSAR